MIIYTHQTVAPSHVMFPYRRTCMLIKPQVMSTTTTVQGYRLSCRVSAHHWCFPIKHVVLRHHQATECEISLGVTYAW
jgi:hypothetical protein